jgi:hypothetical protein
MIEEEFAVPNHWPKERSRLDEEWGCTWCRRCGRMLVKDRYPDWVQTKPCEVVRVTLRKAGQVGPSHPAHEETLPGGSETPEPPLPPRCAHGFIDFEMVCTSRHWEDYISRPVTA